MEPRYRISGGFRMSFNCRFCGLLIYPSKDHKNVFFEDKDQTVVHNCPKLKRGSYQTNNNDHKLLTVTVTRVSEVEIQQHEHERRITDHDKKLKTITNDLEEIKLKLNSILSSRSNQ